MQTNRQMSFCHFLITLLLGIVSVTEAFQPALTFQGALLTKSAKSNRQVGITYHDSTSLSAWTLPSSNGISKFSTPTWYNEYHPTARRTVYNDAPMEFTFLSIGDDWSTTYEQPAEGEFAETSQKPTMGPLRRAYQWAAKRVRRR